MPAQLSLPPPPNIGARAAQSDYALGSGIGKLLREIIAHKRSQAETAKGREAVGAMLPGGGQPREEIYPTRASEQYGAMLEQPGAQEPDPYDKVRKIVGGMTGETTQNVLQKTLTQKLGGDPAKHYTQQIKMPTDESETGLGYFQYNPDSGTYDKYIGPAQKPSRGMQFKGYVPGTNEPIIFDPRGGRLMARSRGGEREHFGGPGMPTSKKIISENTLGQIGTFDAILDGVKHIRTIATERQDFLGPVEGRWNKLKSNFVDNPDFTVLDREVESLITIAYALSGKQISEKEMRLLKAAILPSVTQPDANFMAALDHAETWLMRNRGRKVEQLKTSGYRVSPEVEGLLNPQRQSIQQPTTTTGNPFDAPGR